MFLCHRWNLLFLRRFSPQPKTVFRGFILFTVGNLNSFENYEKLDVEVIKDKKQGFDVT